MNEPQRATPPERDRRAFVGEIELRKAADGSASPGTLIGYGAVFNKLSLDLGCFREQIAPGAFAGCLADDVRGLVNHEECLLIGRTPAGTMRLSQDDVGLRCEIDLPDTTVGRDVAENVRLRNMTGMSFSFIVDVDTWDWSGTVPIRTIERVKQLFDVGPVTFPAYDQTTVAMRSYTAASAARTAPTASPSLSLAKARQRLADAF